MAVTIAEPSPMNFEEAKDILKEKMVAEKALDKIKSDLDEAKKFYHPLRLMDPLSKKPQRNKIQRHEI